jgi:HrpA-like RNA helicase
MFPVIDEVHERNADMDMLLAMGKQAVWQRKMNGLPPLNLVLMSATTDSVFWSKYFQKYNMKVVTIHVPEARRFPIDIIHLDDSRFPGGNPNVRSIDFLRTNPRFGRNAFSRDHTYMYQQDRWRNNNGEYVGDALPGLTEEYATGAAFDNAYLLELKRKQQDDFDDILCRATAETILQIAEKDPGLNGSILCFLPGMEEIRLTDKYIDQFGGAHLRKKFDVLYLHSSVSSIEQNRVFISGPKVILSTVSSCAFSNLLGFP